MLGPFKNPHIPNLHISPFLTIENPCSSNRQAIVYLSYPQGESLNASIDVETYPGSKFCITLPSVDYITNKVKQLGQGSILYKVDISRTFRQVPIDPGDYNVLGLYCDSYVIDKSLPFVFKEWSAISQHLSEAIKYIMMKKRFHKPNYVDNIIGQASLLRL